MTEASVVPLERIFDVPDRNRRGTVFLAAALMVFSGTGCKQKRGGDSSSRGAGESDTGASSGSGPETGQPAVGIDPPVRWSESCGTDALACIGLVATTAEDDDLRRDMLSSLAILYTRSGQYDEAIEVIGSIEDPSSRANAAGESLRFISVTCTTQDVERYVQASRDEERSPYLYVLAARSFHALGETEQVLDLAEEREDPDVQARILRTIAESASGEGACELALDITGSEDALWEVAPMEKADVLMRCDRLEDAEALLATDLGDHDHMELMTALIVRHVEAGRKEEAWKTLEARRDTYGDGLPGHVWSTRMASAHAKAGLADEALDLCGEIDGSYMKDWCVLSVAEDTVVYWSAVKGGSVCNQVADTHLTKVCKQHVQYISDHPQRPIPKLRMKPIAYDTPTKVAWSLRLDAEEHIEAGRPERVADLLEVVENDETLLNLLPDLVRLLAGAGEYELARDAAGRTPDPTVFCGALAEGRRLSQCEGTGTGKFMSATDLKNLIDAEMARNLAREGKLQEAKEVARGIPIGALRAAADREIAFETATRDGIDAARSWLDEIPDHGQETMMEIHHTVAAALIGRGAIQQALLWSLEKRGDAYLASALSTVAHDEGWHWKPGKQVADPVLSGMILDRLSGNDAIETATDPE